MGCQRWLTKGPAAGLAQTGLAITGSEAASREPVSAQASGTWTSYWILVLIWSTTPKQGTPNSRSDLTARGLDIGN